MKVLSWVLLPLFLFSIDFEKAKKKTIYDFISPSSLNGWNVFCSQINTHPSNGKLTFDTQGAANFSGELWKKETGNFCMMISPIGLMQLRSGSGFMLRLKGDGKHYKFCIYTQPQTEGVSYQAGFNTRKDRLMLVFLPFSSFVPYYQNRLVRDWPVLDQSKMQRIGMMIDDSQAGHFQLKIYWIKARVY